MDSNQLLETFLLANKQLTKGYSDANTNVLSNTLIVAGTLIAYSLLRIAETLEKKV
jgi:hypothetical protein